MAGDSPGRRALFSLVLALAAGPRGAWAQTARPAAFDLQLQQPSASPRALVAVDLPSISSHRSVTLGLWTSFVPTVLQGVDGAPIVRNALTGELSGSLGLFGYLELGLSAPVVLQEAASVQGGVPGAPAQGFSFGDLRAQVKVPLLRGATGLAVRLVVAFPSGGSDRFAGGSSVAVTPSVLLARTIGRVTVATQLGLRLRTRNAVGAFEVNDELQLAAGARVALTPRWSLLAELQGWITVDAGPGQDLQAPVEATGAVRWTPSEALALHLGVGRGLSEGYGTPDARIFAGLRVTVSPDRCPHGPEDYDGFEDGDFCRDPDNDRDRIPDEQDRCENDPEDRDGTLDDDGCPDPDNDGDGVLDEPDRCPVDPEDHDGFQDTDGCPEPDNDRDGIPDVLDLCANEPEDRDDFQDDDGCPEPGPDPATVTRSGSRLLVNQRVFFDYDSDTLSNVSFPILDAVADALQRNPDIQRLRVEGHTDAQGSPEYNLDLSFRRARSVVEYLVRRGVSRERLEFQGYGQLRPVSAEDSPEAFALNRRVDFTITQELHGPSTTQHTPPPAGRSPRPGRPRGP